MTTVHQRPMPSSHTYPHTSVQPRGDRSRDLQWLEDSSQTVHVAYCSVSLARVAATEFGRPHLLDVPLGARVSSASSRLRQTGACARSRLSTRDFLTRPRVELRNLSNLAIMVVGCVSASAGAQLIKWGEACDVKVMITHPS